MGRRKTWVGGMCVGTAALLVVMAVAWATSPATTSDQSAASSEVAVSFLSPGPSPCGLAWDGSYLWVADDSTDTIYKLDPANGTVLESLPTPGDQPRGLTWDGSHFWTADQATRMVYKLDAEGTVLADVEAPSLDVEGQTPEVGGVAFDGEHLWCGVIHGWSSQMFQVDVKDGSVKRSYFTWGYPCALATDGKFLWSATHNAGLRSGMIDKYSFSDGMHVSDVEAPGRYPAGLALDGKWLWYVDKETRTIHRLPAE